MALSRCTETRLLEAVWYEVKACFARSDLGLTDKYFPNGVAKIYAHPFDKEEQLTLTPWTIVVTPIPPRWTPGVGGAGDNYYVVEVAFIFPKEAFHIQPGRTTFLDHIDALRRWLVDGGSWAEEVGHALAGMPIRDPDNSAKEVAHMRSFAQTEDFEAPNNCGIVVPVLIEFETFETDEGDIV
jgi:hypothetical protein